LDTRDEQLVGSIRTDVGEATDQLKSAQASLKSSAHAELTGRVVGEVPELLAKFEELVTTMKRLGEALDSFTKQARQLSEAADTIQIAASTNAESLKVSTAGTIDSAQTFGGFGGIVAILVGMAMAFLIARSITKPILGMVTTMDRLAAGETKIEIPG